MQEKDTTRMSGMRCQEGQWDQHVWQTCLSCHNTGLQLEMNTNRWTHLCCQECDVRDFSIHQQLYWCLKCWKELSGER